MLVIDRKPRNHGELLAFVAHYGAGVARTKVRCSLEDVALRAVLASRRDPSLARMLPVFLWRVRDELELDEMIAGSRRRGIARALGYFLDVTGSLGSWRGFDAAIAKLRKDARPNRPTYFFLETGRHPFEAMAAQERTPIEARRWGLLTGTPTESFATYFRKVARL